jgi:CelD/BcsL family acetyltransferase involved in cellulose biosynthesis
MTARLELADPAWAAFVSSQAEAGPFHHPAWATLLADCYGFRGFALVAATDGAIEAGLPILDAGRGRLVSLPFTDSCAPLGPAAALLGSLPRLELHAPFEAPQLVPAVRGVVHRLELEPDADAVHARFRTQMRRNVARARREGVVVRAGETRADLLDVFYGLHLRTRRRQGVPVQPRRFFHLLWERLVEPGLATTLLAYRGDTPVAGALFLHWNGTAVYKYGASDPAHWALRPNNLLFWEAIRAACERGDRLFDLGRTDLANEGLRAFKSGWGAREEPLVYAYAGAPPHRERSRLAGPLGLAIRRSPLWLCRAVGAAAYRYAA